MRRAYGNWNISGMQALQGQLVTNGFHLVHVPYPVPKKSSADIAMVVDVMATQARGRVRVRQARVDSRARVHSELTPTLTPRQARMKDLTSFVLATGDSDFSHLFCHLRQDGRRVVGFG